MIAADDLPGVNAILNSAGVVLLVLGYKAIRSGSVRLHKSCMLSALAVSAVFLGSYLYFHLVHRHGQATRFQDQAPSAPNWVAYVYYGILLSHTVLAIVTAPLALYTAYLGLKDRLARHKRIARWTLPIWLYVSITGVVVYWMLYRLY
jgi:putative membrane protein